MILVKKCVVNTQTCTIPAVLRFMVTRITIREDCFPLEIMMVQIIVCVQFVDFIIIAVFDTTLNASQ